MKLLLDEGLAYSTAQALTKAGHDTIRVFDFHVGGAPDEQLLRLAADQGRVIVTLDSHFHSMLALSGARRPSVIRLRIEGLRARPAAMVIMAAIDECQDSLAAGAAVSVTPRRIRVRPLPMRANPHD